MKNCAYCGIQVSFPSDVPRIVYAQGFNLAPRVIHGSCERAYYAFVGNV